MANGAANGIADDIVNALNNSIASSKGNSPVHVEVNDLAKAIDKDRVNRIVIGISIVKPMAKST